MAAAASINVVRYAELAGGAPRLTIKTPLCNGKANCEAFHTQFELLAQGAKWSRREKALQLAMCRTGNALWSLLLLSLNDRTDYDALPGQLNWEQLDKDWHCKSETGSLQTPTPTTPKRWHLQTWEFLIRFFVMLWTRTFRVDYHTVTSFAVNMLLFVS